MSDLNPIPAPFPTETDSFREIGPGDSRYAQKQRDIKATVDKMVAQQQAKRSDWESSFGGELEEATLSSVLRGGGNCVGSTRAYRNNFDKAFGGNQ